MKTVYYLPFNDIPSRQLSPATMKKIKTTVESFKESFLKDNPNVVVMPSFNGKEGFECLPLNN